MFEILYGILTVFLGFFEKTVEIVGSFYKYSSLKIDGTS